VQEGEHETDSSTGGSLLCVDERELSAELRANVACEHAEDCLALEMPCYAGPESVCGWVVANALFGIPPALDAASQCEGSCARASCVAVPDCVEGVCTLQRLGTCEDALADADAFVEAHSACEAATDCQPLSRGCYPKGEETCGSLAMSVDGAAEANQWNRLAYALQCTEDCNFDLDLECGWGCVEGRCQMFPP
jgi:hypothetical protein